MYCFLNSAKISEMSVNTNNCFCNTDCTRRWLWVDTSTGELQSNQWPEQNKLNYPEEAIQMWVFVFWTSVYNVFNGVHDCFFNVVALCYSC